MRKILAILLMAIGIGAVAVGLYGRTTISAASSVSVPIPAKNVGAYVVIDPGVTTLGEGKPANITITGPAGVKVGAFTGLASDVKDFIGDSKSAHVTGLKSWTQANLVTENPTGPVRGPDPSKSDNWIATASGVGTLKLVAPTPNPALGPIAMLIATDGNTPAPTAVTLSWDLMVDATWTIIAMVVGVALALAGAIMLLSASRSNRMAHREAEHARKLQEAAAKAHVFDDALVREEPAGAASESKRTETQAPTVEVRKREGLR